MSYDPTGSCCYCDEGIIDLEPHMQEALEYVIDVILRHGQIPRPSLVDRPQFDLYEWLAENMDYELREFAFAMTLDLYRSRHSEILEAWRENIRRRLMDDLANSEIVMQMAEHFAEAK